MLNSLKLALETAVQNTVHYVFTITDGPSNKDTRISYFLWQGTKYCIIYFFGGSFHGAHDFYSSYCENKKIYLWKMFTSSLGKT